VSNKFIARSFAIMALSFASATFAASPTVDDVYQATRAGRIAEAEAMMQQVLTEHPNSATAHYVSAQVEYRAGHLDRARAEFAKAEQLSPGLPKESPQAVAQLRAGLSSGGMVRADRVPRTQGAHFPWMIFLLIGGAVVLLVMLFRRNRQQTMMPPSYGPGFGPNGAPGGPMPMGGPGYSYGPGVMNQGSGIMGNVASGLAVGAGIVAGEALARRFLEPGHPDYVDSSQQNYVDPNADMGGNDFGASGGWDDGGGFSDGGGGDWS
jgi:hypothetical protein